MLNSSRKLTTIQFLREATVSPDIGVAGDDSKVKDQIATVYITKNAHGGPRVVYLDTPCLDTAPLKKVADWMQTKYVPTGLPILDNQQGPPSVPDTTVVSAFLYFPKNFDGRSDTTESRVRNLQLIQQHYGLDESEFCRRAFLGTMVRDERNASRSGVVGDSPYQLQLVPLIKKEEKGDALWQEGKPRVVPIKDVFAVNSRVVVQSSDIVILCVSSP